MVPSRDQHREWEQNFVVRFGKKFSLSVLCIFLGFVVHVLAMMFVAATVDEARARLFADLAGTFTNVLMVGIAAFSGADAFITWKTGRFDPAKAGPGPNRPPARESGTAFTSQET
jgi:hypothetical protein